MVTGPDVIGSIDNFIKHQSIRQGSADAVAGPANAHCLCCYHHAEGGKWVMNDNDNAQPDNLRPKEKLLAEGSAGLSDAELLACLLQTGSRDSDAATVAQSLIDQFGGLRELLTMSRIDFCAAPGLGDAKYAQLKAALEIAARYFTGLSRDAMLNSPQDAVDYLQVRLAHYPHEVLACLFLDNRRRIIRYEELFLGTLANNALSPREIARRALAHNASAVIPAHNRPNGNIEIGDIDHQVSLALKDALAMVEVRMLDYVVIGNGEALSLAGRGWV